MVQLCLVRGLAVLGRADWGLAGFTRAWLSPLVPNGAWFSLLLPGSGQLSLLVASCT